MESLLRALRTSPDLVPLSHPTADRGEFLAALQESIRSGYLRGGFPAAHVTVEADADGEFVRVRIDEGERLLAGSIRVEGNTVVSDADIARALTQPREGVAGSEPAWVAGEPAPLDGGSLQRHWALVKNEYAEQGLHIVEGSVRTESREDGTSDLVVSIDTEGPVMRIDRIELEGIPDGEQANVLSHLGLKEGMVYSDRLARDVVATLEGLGRYTKAALEAVQRDASRGVVDPLRISVQPASFAPAWEKTPWEDMETLRKALDWLVSSIEREAHFAVEFSTTASVGEGLVRFGQGSGELRLSGQGFLLSTDAIHVGGAGGLLALGLEGSTFYAALGSTKTYTRMVGLNPPNFSLRLQAGPRPDGEFGFVWGFGVTADDSSPTLGVQADVKDVVFLRLLTDESQGLEVRSSDESLSIIANPEGESPIEFLIDRETGELQLDADIPQPAGHIDIRLERSSLEDRFAEWTAELGEQGYREVPPMEFLQSLIGASLEALVGDSGWEDETAQALVGWTLRDLGDLLVFELEAEDDGEEEREVFRLPSPELLPGDMSAILLQWARTLRYSIVGLGEFEYGSWPAVLCRELPELLLNVDADARLAASHSIGTLFQQKKIGPLGCLIAAKILAERKLTGLAGAFARFPQTVDFEPAWTDLLALGPPGSPGEEVLLALDRNWRGLHEAAITGEGLDDEVAREVLTLFATAGESDLAFARAGLERLWAAGLGDMVREVLMAYR